MSSLQTRKLQQKNVPEKFEKKKWIIFQLNKKAMKNKTNNKFFAMFYEKNALIFPYVFIIETKESSKLL